MPVKTDCIISVECPCGYHARVHFAPANAYCKSTRYECSGLCGRVYDIIDYMNGITIYYLWGRKMNITIGGKNREVTDEQMEQIEKLLRPELRTPDNIRFTHRGSKVTGLQFNSNKQVLQIKDDLYLVSVARHYLACWGRKLVPTKREDLKPGDVVFRSDDDDDNFKYIENYGIVIDEYRVAFATEKQGIHLDDLEYDFWWKVI